MELFEYQQRIQQFKKYPARYGLGYTVLALTGEAGEMANELKKVMRGDRPLEQAKDSLISELGDVLWYVAACADELGVSLEYVAGANLDKLERRAKENVS